jgi:hypothetical protein
VSSVGTITRIDFDRSVRVQIREDTGADDQDYSGWWCVATAPYPCPAEGCDFVAGHLTVAHLIVVWPERDDPDLLRFAVDARELGRDPKVVEWNPDLGPCISYFRWVRIGRPVHGKAVRPDGWRDDKPD